MMDFIVRLAVIGAVAFAGWIAGSMYPAPEALLERLNPQAVRERAVARFSSVDWDGFKRFLPQADLDRFSLAALEDAAASGGAIVIDRSDVVTERSDAVDVATLPEATAVAASANQVGNQAFETTLSLCPRMTVSNAPRADATGKLVNFAPLTTVQGVTLAKAPTKGACLSSAFGPRGARQHKGVDFYAVNGAPILAAGDGTIVELKYRDDFGNMLLIDHGKGVYTRYAHLASFQRGLASGAKVRAGDPIGLMGNTASYSIPVHLHYEVLLGDYANPKASFGLTPHNPFS